MGRRPRRAVVHGITITMPARLSLRASVKMTTAGRRPRLLPSHRLAEIDQPHVAATGAHREISSEPDSIMRSMLSSFRSLASSRRSGLTCIAIHGPRAEPISGGGASSAGPRRGTVRHPRDGLASPNRGACQGPMISARGRSVDLPVGGRQKCPLMASGSAQGFSWSMASLLCVVLLG